MASTNCTCTLLLDPHDMGPMIPMRRYSRSRIDISPEINLKDNEPMDLIFELTRDFFAKANIPITEVQSWGHLVIVLE
ncbi:uncharacterized protein N7518_003747 [Penicillium psychrosexuale]|uniref:uncharacterized protein n=1 Tax=Penicillium psychrosexuale TaxID=1002107 RepID=UPI00254540AB|nr:uncharacterized protein N7518_003747 [Penicillium psychrosexuale]KAJ5801679.1 hypothetical protein N7518_003747 [Penicillium psychrosexuale]